MNNINFDSGIKEFSINGDETRTLMFNPTDVEFVNKAQNMRKAIVDFMTPLMNKNDELTIEEMATVIVDVDNKIKEELNIFFNDNNASTKIFGGVSSLTLVDGQTIVERFLNAFTSVITPYIEEETKKANKRLSKYQKEYKQYVREVTEKPRD